ncbi:hypothetical protein C8R44DRAFT_256367 [Mycena epipterygia]|nr:hypothetical protein C8R44DRAFT_256367 [Mycena epipterygia]
MTEDFAPSIHIEPPPDSDEQALFASLGMFDNNNYCQSSETDHYSMADRRYPQTPALFIQPSEPQSLYSPSNSGRSSPIDAWSPVSSFSGDIFPDDFSSDELAPHWTQQHGLSGQSSPVSPSLSPLTSAFDGFVLDESYANAADHSVLSGPPAFSRLRSSSHSAPSVSPGEVWADGVGRGRSASVSAATSDNQFFRNDGSVVQRNFPPYGYSDNNEVQISVADAEASFSDSLGTGMSWGSMPADRQGNENAAGLGHLVSGWRYPHSNERPSSDSLPERAPPSPSHLTVPAVGLQRRGACSARQRSRSHSDLNSLLPPDQETGRGRGQHRAALSIPNSRSVSDSSRSVSPHGPIFFSDVQTPASYSPSAPSSPAFDDAETHGGSVERRRTLAAIRGPGEFLSPVATLTRASSAPSKGRRSKASPANSGLGVFKAERTESSTFLSQGNDGPQPQAASQQEFRISQPLATPTFKLEVGTKKIRQASNARRLNAATFSCPLAGCSSTFTARHNLMNHINSHNKYRPHRCTCGMSFTTQGVLNRHKKRCRK